MLILCEEGGGLFIVFALLHFKDNYFFDHFIYWQLILQFSFPSFPLDNMHSVQWIPNMWSYDIIAAIVYVRYLDVIHLLPYS